MADGYVTAAMVGLRAALIAAPEIAALVGDRVVDEPEQDIAFPYVRFGRTEEVTDDTDNTAGALVHVGFEVHSRPSAGRIEAARICKLIKKVLHRSELVAVPGYSVVDVEVQTWSVHRLADGKTYEGRLALELRLSA